MSTDIPAIHAAVHRFCRSRMWTGDGVRSSEDIAQEALAQFIKGDSSAIVDPMGFAICIAERRIIDEIKRRVRNRFYPMGLLNDGEELGDKSTTGVGVEQIVVARLEWDEAMARAVTVRSVIFDVLDDTQRQILWLRSGLNMPAAEVGERLGMSKGAVRVAHHRILVRVRAALALGASP